MVKIQTLVINSNNETFLSYLCSSKSYVQQKVENSSAYGKETDFTSAKLYLSCCALTVVTAMSISCNCYQSVATAINQLQYKVFENSVVQFVLFTVNCRVPLSAHHCVAMATALISPIEI